METRCRSKGFSSVALSLLVCLTKGLWIFTSVLIPCTTPGNSAQTISWDNNGTHLNYPQCTSFPEVIMLHVSVYFEKESEGEYSLYLNQEQKLVGSSSYYILGCNWSTKYGPGIVLDSGYAVLNQKNMVPRLSLMQAFML